MFESRDIAIKTYMLTYIQLDFEFVCIHVLAAAMYVVQSLMKFSKWKSNNDLEEDAFLKILHTNCFSLMDLA
jgi:hypothetical protein